jgi:prepilin-type N-terminal cleavage/methylation domain-containing protein
MPRLRSRPGFTLAEVVVSTVILVVAAAVVVPYLAAQNRRKQAEDTRTILFSLTMSLNTPHSCIVASNGCVGSPAPLRTASYLGILQRVNSKYPQQLHHLTTKIPLTERSCNGSLYVAADTVAWNPVGAAPGGSSQWPPYSGVPIVTGNGVLTPMGWVHDSVLNSTNGVTSIPGWVEVHIDSLSLDDAQELDLAVDGSISPTAGLLRFAANGSYQLARFLIPAPVNGGVTLGC